MQLLSFLSFSLGRRSKPNGTQDKLRERVRQLMELTEWEADLSLPRPIAQSMALRVLLFRKLVDDQLAEDFFIDQKATSKHSMYQAISCAEISKTLMNYKNGNGRLTMIEVINALARLRGPTIRRLLTLSDEAFIPAVRNELLLIRARWKSKLNYEAMQSQRSIKKIQD